MGPPQSHREMQIQDQEILFPTQSDGRKVKEPGDTKLLERPQGRAHQWALGQRWGAGSRVGAEETQPRTLAECPGGSSVVLTHSTPSKCGLGVGLGRSKWGFISIFFNAGGLGSILGLGRSPGEGNGYPLQYSCLENPHEQRSLVGYSL